MKASDSDEKIVSVLENLLKQSKGYLSPADASAATGYAIYEVNDALARLIELYNARVRMNPENGQVQFVFNYPLEKRGKQSFKEIFFKIGESLWKVFKVVYKASIAIVLVFYTILFVLILLALKLSSKDNDNFDFGDIIAGLFRGLMDAFVYSIWIDSFNYHYDDYGNRYKVANREQNKGRGFIKSVFSFVFGPDRPAYNPLEDTKEAAAFIRKNNGILTSSHIVALSGVDYDTASSKLAEYAVKFQGDLRITEDGYVVAEFVDMMNISVKQFDGPITFYEEEVEPPYELTGNSTGRNVAIAGLNLFNLIMSSVVISFFSGTPEFTINEAGKAVVYSLQDFSFLAIALGYFPLIYSLLFFLIPIFRTISVKKLNKKRENNIIRKKLIGAFLRIRSKAVSLLELTSIARIDNGLLEKIKVIMEKLVVELRGEINIDSSGIPVYSFPVLDKELKH